MPIISHNVVNPRPWTYHLGMVGIQPIYGDFRMVYDIVFLAHKTILDTQFVTLRMGRESSRHYVSAGKHQVVGG